MKYYLCTQHRAAQALPGEADTPGTPPWVCSLLLSAEKNSHSFKASRESVLLLFQRPGHEKLPAMGFQGYVLGTPPPHAAVQEVYSPILLQLLDVGSISQNQRALSTYCVPCTDVSSCAASAEQDRGACGPSRMRGRYDTERAPETTAGRAGSV